MYWIFIKAAIILQSVKLADCFKSSNSHEIAHFTTTGCQWVKAPPSRYPCRRERVHREPDPVEEVAPLRGKARTGIPPQRQVNPPDQLPLHRSHPQAGVPLWQQPPRNFLHRPQSGAQSDRHSRLRPLLIPGKRQQGATIRSWVNLF